MNGFVNILKPPGPTASDVVVKVRRILGCKVGHLGTLDPGAAGVLPVAVGKGTKLFDFLVFKKKKYRATFTFGITTDTLDSYGKITGQAHKIPEYAEVLNVAQKLTGKISQMPPQYSAKSVGGVRAYDLARKGIEVELKPREVEIYSIDRVIFKYPDTYSLDILCSGGTYIRSIARDMAEETGTVGYMSSLIRLSTGAFDIKNAVTLEEFEASPSSYLLPLDFPLGELDALNLSQSEHFRLTNGAKVIFKPFNGIKRAYYQDALIGLVLNKDGFLKMEYNLQ
jgi:tRNA pseudouridine55 synthase